MAEVQNESCIDTELEQKRRTISYRNDYSHPLPIWGRGDVYKRQALGRLLNRDRAALSVVLPVETEV